MYDGEKMEIFLRTPFILINNYLNKKVAFVIITLAIYLWRKEKGNSPCLGLMKWINDFYVVARTLLSFASSKPIYPIAAKLMKATKIHHIQVYMAISYQFKIQRSR